MSYEIRPITPDEFPAFLRADYLAFGGQPTEEEIERGRETMEHDRHLAAMEDGQIVGTAGAYSFDLTLPGLTTIPVAGVTAVGVLPTHRRQGILRALMRRQLADIRERGEPVAVLTASESSIYRRFGYGVSCWATTVEIDRRNAALSDSPEPTGQIRLIEHETAIREVLPAVYERVRQRQPGMLSRNEKYWSQYRRTAEKGPEGFGPRFCLAYSAASGEVDGYAQYRIKQEWEFSSSKGTVLVGELYALTAEAYAALWSYCLRLDLMQTVRAPIRPMDEPLRHMLADPRRLRIISCFDSLWVRLLDIPAALAARRYASEGRLVLDVADPFCPENSGRYTLDGGPVGAECHRTSDNPDLALDVADLGAVYLGGNRFTTLAHAGRAAERTPGALVRADRIFASDPAPWCTQEF
jgi:predicted acetyltransferase